MIKAEAISFLAEGMMDRLSDTIMYNNEISDFNTEDFQIVLKATKGSYAYQSFRSRIVSFLEEPEYEQHPNATNLLKKLKKEIEKEHSKVR